MNPEPAFHFDREVFLQSLDAAGKRMIREANLVVLSSKTAALLEAWQSVGVPISFSREYFEGVEGSLLELSHNGVVSREERDGEVLWSLRRFGRKPNDLA